MGGGGGGSSFPRPTAELQDLVRRTKDEVAQEQFDADVNQYLREVNGTFERDPDRIRSYLAQIGEILEDSADMEQFLFGGSVAKRTYVDGISDVDALVVLRAEIARDKSPKQVLALIDSLLRRRLSGEDAESVDEGRMAVTVRFRDGPEIQLLPAIRIGDRIAIPGSGAAEWRETDPRRFQRELSAENQRVSGTLIPSIKLIKAANSGLAEQKQLTGYHVEVLSLDAVRTYQGPNRIKDLLLHIVNHIASRVKRPIEDVTGQSRAADTYLGPQDSQQRRVVADAFLGISRRLEAAKTVKEWRDIIEG